MHQLGRSHNLAAECLTDGLMAQADSENGNAAAEMLNDFQGNTGVVGRARTG
jgi:hypothetical protein